MTQGRGLIIAAPQSGSGKTTVTLGLLRALSRRGIAVRGAKSGPDYIDPAYHRAACGQPCANLDAWAMASDRIRALAGDDGLLIVEGAMGLFDGAPPEGKGATADLARILGLPVILVVDAARMAQSVAPLVAGFTRQDPRVRVAGVILNRVASERHLAMLTAALRPTGIPVLGALMRDSQMSLPSRHLGLVQAGEHPELEAFLTHAARRVVETVDLAAIEALAAPLPGATFEAPTIFADARSIAIARDAAFTFCYPHQITDWRDRGIDLRFFSPLANDTVPEADVVFLPGGYPELHAAQLAASPNFMQSLRNAAQSSAIYGECGGYMVLGQTLVEGDGTAHSMAGLLDLETSFATRKLHLGYRTLVSRSDTLPGRFKAHEFHYATTIRAEGTPLFEVRDAEGKALPPMGLQAGRVMGSFAHVIERVVG